MIYKAFIAQKVIALLLHEFFWVSYCKTLHQLNAAIYDFTLLRFYAFTPFSVVRFFRTTKVYYFARIILFAFPLVK